MINNCNKKNKYYFNNNIYPIYNKNNIYLKNSKNKFNNKFCTCIKPLYEVEDFLNNINKISKCIKLIKFLN